MAHATTSYVCGNCGAQSIRWLGRCHTCREYGTVTESRHPATGSRSSPMSVVPARAAIPMSQIPQRGPQARMTTGIGEFDRLLGGGLVPGQVVLIAGEPGAGKSTLVLQVADAVAVRTRTPTLYIAGEESAEQIAIRARRIGADSELLLVSDDTDLASVIGHVEQRSADLSLIVVDSVQSIASSDLDSRAGGVAQVMEVAQVLTRICKSRGVPALIVGQVTKESTVAGPRALEHTVDTTLTLEGDRHTSLRLLRAMKNRYGPTDEVACFEQTDVGLLEVPDPSALFLADREEPVPGTCATVTVEGRRALVAEVQALVAGCTIPNPRRGVSGLEASRVAMLSAVTERTIKVRLSSNDVFVATLGGMRLRDPAADLAVCIALATAARDIAPLANMAAVGEVTLSGEVRPVRMVSQRVAEAKRLGCRQIFAAAGTHARLDAHLRSNVVEAPTLAQALGVILRPRGTAPLKLLN